MTPTREEWDKDWANWLKKGQVWFTDGASNQQGTGAGICKYQNKIQWHISLENNFKNYIGNVRKSYQKILEYFGHFREVFRTILRNTS